MPLTGKGKKIKAAMEREYGKEKGESVFYASQNKGTVKGTEREARGRSTHKESSRHEKKERGR